MDNINEITKKIVKFRNERNWKQFHNQKDMAISLSLEAAAYLKHSQTFELILPNLIHKSKKRNLR